nr:hypothetical protein [Deltaproteobacteria bacterium]
ARGDLVAIARGLLSGGSVRVGDPSASDLALHAAAVERHVPETPIARRGAWIASPTTIEEARVFASTGSRGASDRAGMTSGATSDRVGVSTADRVAELLAAAARASTSSEARAWRVVCDLAEARGESPDGVVASLNADPLSDEERAALAYTPITTVDSSLTARLHAWGRGRFDLCPTAGSLLDRLADAIALRVVAELASGGDPEKPLAEARWYSLLPADRRTSLLDNLIARASSLRSLVETTHA